MGAVKASRPRTERPAPDGTGKFLVGITSLPTASGREDAVAAFLERWTAARKALSLSRDRYGNILIARGDFRRASRKKPIYITAHLDHPAFVAASSPAPGRVKLEFRGGVLDPYFKSASIEILDGGKIFPARVVSFNAKAKPFKTAEARLTGNAARARIPAGSIGRWKLPKPSIRNGLLFTYACDDLAGVAAALSAYDAVFRDRRLGHVALLFTRAEETGFVGAIGAARGGTIRKGARLLCLECSRSFPHDSPTGAGPIVRVGDRLSVFSPDLTNAVAAIAAGLQKTDPSFRFQRKLMPGGACEATAFSGYGISATCLCLPLLNYHNMADIDGVTAGKKKARVAREGISINDFKGLVRLLRAAVSDLDLGGPSIRDSMEKIWSERRGLLSGGRRGR